MSQCIHHGGCLCGDARYTVRAEPVRTTICHCRFCQRFTGTAFLVEPIFLQQAVAFCASEPLKSYHHISDESGKRVTVNFCGRCGSTLYLSFERFPDFIGVCAGTFDDPNWFDRGPGSCRHIFTRSAQKGVVLPASVKIYQAHATRADGEANEARVLVEPVTVE
jgi:hypothetical protein